MLTVCQRVLQYVFSYWLKVWSSISCAKQYLISYQTILKITMFCLNLLVPFH